MEDTMDLIKRLNKAELHIHLTGAYPLPYLLSIATNEERTKLLHHLSIVSKIVPYKEIFKYFQIIEQIVNTEDRVEAGCRELMLQLARQNVTYVELRTGLKDLGKGREAYVQSVLRGMQSVIQVQAVLILSIRRDTSSTILTETIDLAIKYQYYGIGGIDISGDSTIHPQSSFYEQVRQAKQANVALLLHLGETEEEIDTEEKRREQFNVLTLVKPIRLGHGVHLTTECWDYVLKNRIPIEVCPTMSVLANMIGSKDTHPAITHYLQSNHPIVISTDDPLVCQTDINLEYLKVLQTNQLCNTDQVKDLISNSFKYALKYQAKL